MKKHPSGSLLLFFSCFIVGSVFCNPNYVDAHSREKRNIICLFGLTDLIKDSLYSSLQDIRKQDKIALADTEDGQIFDGVLKGLSTLRNTTNLEVFCNEDEIIIFTTTLRMRNTEVRYNWTRRVVFKLKGSVWMTAKNVDFDMEVRLNTTSGLNFEVTNSVITKVDDFEIGFKGLGVLNPLVKKVLKRKMKEKAAIKIGMLLKKALQTKLGRVARSLDWIPFL